MAVYLVTIEGNPARAAGLLAKAGIQNTEYSEHSVKARLHAPDADTAADRVRHALSGEEFTIAASREE